MGYTFASYNLRATTEEDREKCAAWILADPTHQVKVSSDFYITPEVGIEKFILEDKHGEPIFYFRMMRAIRVNIQFGPATSRTEKQRHAEALENGLAWLQMMAADSAIREIVCETVSKELAAFITSDRIGFHKSPFDLVCGITPNEAQAAQENKLQPLHQSE